MRRKLRGRNVSMAFLDLGEEVDRVDRKDLLRVLQMGVVVGC